MFSALTEKVQSLSSLYLVSILFLFVTFCYVNTLRNGLFFDDEHFIYNNEAVKTFDLGGFFSHGLTSGAGRLSNYYRPLLFFGFGLEYQMFGNNGFIYHLDSYLIHFAGGVFLYLLIKKLFENKLLAFLATLLFLIHPVQTEAVAYASGRGDPLSFFFVMVTLYLSLYKGRWYRLSAILSFTAALLSKEIALITPGLIFLVQLFSQQKLTFAAMKKSFVATIPFAVITLIYFFSRITVLNFANTLNFYNSANIYSSNLFVRLVTFFHVMPDYLGLLFYPKTLFMERDLGIKIVTTPTIQGVLSILFYISLLIVGWLKRTQRPVLLFSILWIVVAFVPTSGILPINGIFYEHFLYYPSVGFFLLFAYSFLALVKKVPKIGKEVLGLVFIIGIIVLSLRTIARNAQWHDPVTFYTQTLSHVRSPRAYNNLAMAYADQGKDKEAIVAYKKAIELVDVYPEPHYNLANIYLAINETANAEKEYKNALKNDPSFYLSYSKLYQIYSEEKDQQGKMWVKEQLIILGKKNSGFLQLLQQLEQTNR